MNLPRTLLIPHFLPPCTCRFSSSKHSGSSSQYLARQAKDPYVKSALSSSYASRAAYKLIELNDRYRAQMRAANGKGKGKEVATGSGSAIGLVRSGMNIVDLGAAPGGWTQVAWELMDRDAQVAKGSRKGKLGQIIALDLLPLKPDVASLPEVTFIQGDFEDPIILAKLLSRLNETTHPKEGGVDLILSDLLPNMSGTTTTDSASSYSLNLSVLSFATQVLPPPPSSPPPPSHSTDRIEPPPTPPPQPQLVMKHLTSALTVELREKLKEFFTVVRWEKPFSSRKASREGFWVCSGFKGGQQGEEVQGEKSRDGDGSEGSIYF